MVVKYLQSVAKLDVSNNSFLLTCGYICDTTVAMFLIIRLFITFCLYMSTSTWEVSRSSYCVNYMYVLIRSICPHHMIFTLSAMTKYMHLLVFTVSFLVLWAMPWSHYQLMPAQYSIRFKSLAYTEVRVSPLLKIALLLLLLLCVHKVIFHIHLYFS